MREVGREEIARKLDDILAKVHEELEAGASADRIDQIVKAHPLYRDEILAFAAEWFASDGSGLSDDAPLLPAPKPGEGEAPWDISTRNRLVTLIEGYITDWADCDPWQAAQEILEELFPASAPPQQPAPGAPEGWREKLSALLARASKGPWDWDTEDNEGSYGVGPNTREGFKSAFITDADGKKVFDTINSDVGCVHEEFGGDENGEYASAWDDVSYANAELVVFLKNNADAILTSSSAKPGGEEAETGWLIERDGPLYLYVETDAGERNARQHGPITDDCWWTPDHERALRFARQADAETYWRGHWHAPDGLARPVEHQWVRP